MPTKKPLPIWMAIVAIAAVVGVVALVLVFMTNQSPPTEMLVRGRMKPGPSNPIAAGAHYGMARGTPVISSEGASFSDPRARPPGR